MPSTQPSRQQPPKKHGNRRVRYDRILAVLLIFIELIVILTKCCTSCSKKKNNAETPPVTTSAQTEAPTEATTEAGYSSTVYLSPSNQTDNKFYTGDTTEAAVCRIVAEKVKTILEQSGYTVLIAGENDTLETKTAMGANNLAAYVAIHTNAGDGVGTDCYYNGNSAQSKALAQAVYDPVAELTPTDDGGLIDGAQSGSDSQVYEVSSNQSPACLIEMEYHDGPNVAQWILDNEDKLAQAVATGILNYLRSATSTQGGTANGIAATTTAASDALGGESGMDALTTTTTAQGQLSVGN